MIGKVLRAQTALFAVLLLAPCGIAAADYSLDVRFDPETKTVGGQAVVAWTNSQTVPAQDLRFHLYFNAWRDRNTSFLRSHRTRDREFDEWRDDDWGGNEITSLILVTELPSDDPEVTSTQHTDLTQKIEFVQPDDSNPQDRTVMRVPLAQPIPPGVRVRIEIDFETKIPRTFARTGIRGNYVFLAHWFPKLGVFQEDGTWNCHQFIQTEFFSEFGDYDARIRIPENWVMGATGTLQEKEDHGDGTVTHRYSQANVHEFAWTASPLFTEHVREFEHPGLKPVTMRLLLMSDHRGQEDRYFAATEAALRYYGEWWGEYPYGHVTVVDPAYKSGSGGMEYPTFFTGGTRWLNPGGSGRPEGVTVHEAGHQFWYGIVANNEFEHAWLDEGFNTYSTRRTMLTAFGNSPLERRYFKSFLPVPFPGLTRAPRSVAGLGGPDSSLEADIMSNPSWQQGPGAYGVNSYTKPAMMLLTLERYLGWETFQKVMSTYFDRWKFKHPEPQDFFAVVQEVSQQDLSWFWDQTYYSSSLFDYAVGEVATVGDRQSLLVRRRGEGLFPVEVRVTFENGEVVEEQWDGKGRWHEFFYDSSDKIERVEIDPDETLALDVNRTNNSWSRSAPASFASKKWALKWMIWLQNLMELYAFHT